MSVIFRGDVFPYVQKFADPSFVYLYPTMGDMKQFPSSKLMVENVEVDSTSVMVGGVGRAPGIYAAVVVDAADIIPDFWTLSATVYGAALANPVITIGLVAVDAGENPPPLIEYSIPYPVPFVLPREYDTVNRPLPGTTPTTVGVSNVGDMGVPSTDATCDVMSVDPLEVTLRTWTVCAIPFDKSDTNRGDAIVAAITNVVPPLSEYSYREIDNPVEDCVNAIASVLFPAVTAPSVGGTGGEYTNTDSDPKDAADDPPAFWVFIVMMQVCPTVSAAILNDAVLVESSDAYEPPFIE